MLRIVNCCRIIVPETNLTARNVSFSAVCQATGQKWREARGLPDNPNSFGPLTSLPDYSFLDGRPTPMGSNQRKRLIRQKEIATKIVEFSAELDFAKERIVRMKAKETAERQEIISGKLKPKGHLLVKKE